MSLKPKSAALWVVVPLLAMNMIACGDDEEIPTPVPDPGVLCGNGEEDDGEECDDGNNNPRDACTNECTDATCGDGAVQMAEDCDDGNRIDTDGCNNKCEGPDCGNGVKEPGEACDDGNRTDTDDCTNACVLKTCGDGVVQAPEDCDDGDKDNRDDCTNACTDPACGDGFVQGTEECDEGPGNSDRGSCLSTCKMAECGDGKVETGVELCDDGNRTDTDECTNECLSKDCGDGIKQSPEQCDDGNNDNTDGCTDRCLEGNCGDGIVQGAEDCDDGNKINTDDCLNDCSEPTCGDGIVSGEEVCDEGEDNAPAPARCSEACRLNSCGDGVLDLGEDCDDGADNGDTASCLESCEWNVCGDGKLLETVTPGSTNPNDEVEECDDDNAVNTDACLDTCRWNSCGDGFRYTQPYDSVYDSDEDGNEAEDNPYWEEFGTVEPCDDGNTVSTDSCIVDTAGDVDECVFNSCGDGQVYSTVSDPRNPNDLEECDDNNESDTDNCLTTCVEASCGDGIVQSGEDCDDGNTSNSDACLNTCEEADCGDDFVWRGVEQCDGGAGCSNACVLATCGDGFVQAPEECDDDNANDNDSCLSTCQWNGCGDGLRYMAVTNTANPAAIEACDDGNGIETDHCTDGCAWNGCGDGSPYKATDDFTCGVGYGGQVCDIDLDRDGAGGNDPATYCDSMGASPMDECENFNPVEDCDDGNAEDTDSCLASCEFNDCGDGTPYLVATDSLNNNPLEECDDGVASATCTGPAGGQVLADDACKLVECGDGVVSVLAGETCDPEHPDWDDEEGCTACRVDTCGNDNDNDDGAFAECDDGNTVNTDGCTNDCFYPRCGDGIVQEDDIDNFDGMGNDYDAEDCDDGNTDPTDGCTNACEEADCGDGIRQADEECDYGEASDTRIDGIENDDGFSDTSGFCSNTCQVQCFPSPSRAWAKESEDETCVFVPEPLNDATGTVYHESGLATFVQAEAYCDGLGIGAHLVKIADEDKNNFVHDLVAASLAGDDTALLPQYCAAGSRDLVGCGPDNDGGVVPELCNPEPATIPDPVDDGVDCDDAGDCTDGAATCVVTGTTGVCTIVNPAHDDMDDDTVACGTNNDGGDPALCCTILTDAPYWIGLYDNHTTQIDPPGQWIWIGDETNVSGNGGNSLWESGFPNDIDNDTSTAGQADCGAMIGADNMGTPGEWNDLSCTTRYRFVCEFPLEQSP